MVLLEQVDLIEENRDLLASTMICKQLINQGKLDSNKYVIAPIYQFIIYH